MRAGVIKEIVGKNRIINIIIQIEQEKETYKLPTDLIQLQINDLRSFKNQPCNFKVKNNNIISLIIDGKDVIQFSDKRKKRKHKNIKSKFSRETVQTTEPKSAVAQSAIAPYNFVPVNRVVIEAPVIDENVCSRRDKDLDRHIPVLDRYHNHLFTGHIDLDIKALTPLYIRDTYTLEEEDKKNNRKNGKWENSEFFSPGGVLSIPGSSLRGMVRNLIEIVSWSQMEFIEDKLLYYRSFADNSERFRDLYGRNMVSTDQNIKGVGKYKFYAGYLSKKGQEYYITPAKKYENGKQYRRVEKQSVSKFSWIWQDDGSCIVVSGNAPGKEKDWQINVIDETATPINISTIDLLSFKNDVSRYRDKNKNDIIEMKDGDLLRWLEVELSKKESRKMVPCFYVLWEDENGRERVSFGHTGLFRLGYRLSTKDHLPKAHHEAADNGILDMAQAIFGKPEQFAGRIFFEDAIMSKGQENALMEEVHPKILSAPKPTTFQHYLEQGQRDTKNLLHWNDFPKEETGEGLIRGYKYYWHKPIISINGENLWIDKNVSKYDKLHTRIKPVKPGTSFTGRIRFENLSKVELGALLFVLDLPKGCSHKIGMGKPLGLGSVDIRPSLVCSLRVTGKDGNKGRYEKLFDSGGWYLPESQSDIAFFKKEFANYMLNQLQGTVDYEIDVTDLWEVPRLKELKALLNYNNIKISDWVAHTKYMKKEEFKKRNVLPHSLKVVDAAKNSE